MDTNVGFLEGGAGLLPAPYYPQFSQVEVPDHVTLRKPKDGILVSRRVQPIRAWQGIIQPFANDDDARRVLRLLAIDRAVDVQSGRLSAPPGTKMLRRHALEGLIDDCAVPFDVLVLEFEPPAHPWVFSLSPAISANYSPGQPHMRSDRVLKLASRTLHGLCIYSAAEFSFEQSRPQIPQLLDQAAIFLGKHLIWDKTHCLIDSQTGAIVDLGPNALWRPGFVPPDSVWQVVPPSRLCGYWPGKSALNGRDHLLLDPGGPCWCGSGLVYRDCCRNEEQKRWGVT